MPTDGLAFVFLEAVTVSSILLLWDVGLLPAAAYVANNSAATMLSISNAGIQYVAGNATAEVSVIQTLLKM